jgi:two-component system sensor histidine kinase HydH
VIDSDRARSIFENLLKNAVESSNDQDPQVEVHITTDKKNFVHIFVMDRGDGIRLGDAKKIFDPFFTTKIHGSGIGLSISRQFVKARGGNIRLYAREGGGTVAEVILPRSLHPVKLVEEEVK